jgi:hypothetical protein
MRHYSDPEDWDKYRPTRRYHDEDDAPELDPEDELIEQLERIERSREQLNRHAIALRHLFRRYPGLQQKWEVFIRSGGISASDFERYLDGQLQLRPRIIYQRQHLRLVSNRRPALSG